MLTLTCGKKPLVFPSLSVLVCKTKRLARSVLRFLTGQTGYDLLPTVCGYEGGRFGQLPYCLFSSVDSRVPEASGERVRLRGNNLPLSSQALDGNDVTRSGIHGPLASYIRLQNTTQRANS